MNSHRPRSQNTAKERTLNPEKDLTRKRPRSHVSLEKSSKNYKPLENWAKPNLLPDVTPQPANSFGKCIWRVCHVVKPEPREFLAILTSQRNWPSTGERAGLNRGLIQLINGSIETSPISYEDSQWCAAPFLFWQVWSKGYRWSRASFGGFI